MKNSVWGKPPAKRAKRLPSGVVCEKCGSPMQSIQGVCLERGEYAVECKAGCWACASCGDIHQKNEACPTPLPCDEAVAISVAVNESRTKMEVETFKIESKSEADAYLTDLLARPEFRSAHEVESRASQHVPDAELRKYFIAKGKEILAL